MAGADNGRYEGIVGVRTTRRHLDRLMKESERLSGDVKMCLLGHDLKIPDSIIAYTGPHPDMENTMIVNCHNSLENLMPLYMRENRRLDDTSHFLLKKERYLEDIADPDMQTAMALEKCISEAKKHYGPNVAVLTSYGSHDRFGDGEAELSYSPTAEFLKEIYSKIYIKRINDKFFSGAPLTEVFTYCTVALIGYQSAKGTIMDNGTLLLLTPAAMVTSLSYYSMYLRHHCLKIIVKDSERCDNKPTSDQWKKILEERPKSSIVTKTITATGYMALLTQISYLTGKVAGHIL